MNLIGLTSRPRPKYIIRLIDMDTVTDICTATGMDARMETTMDKEMETETNMDMGTGTRAHGRTDTGI